MKIEEINIEPGLGVVSQISLTHRGLLYAIAINDFNLMKCDPKFAREVKELAVKL